MTPLIERVDSGGDEALAVWVHGGATSLPASLAETDSRAGGALSAAAERKEVAADAAAVTTLYPPQGPSRLFVIGLGKPDDFARRGLAVVRDGAARLARAARAAGVEALTLSFDGPVGEAFEVEALAAAAGDGLSAGRLRFDQFKGAAQGEAQGEASADGSPLRVAVPEGGADAFDRAVATGRGVATARVLGATPPNLADPDAIEQRCRELADEVGLGVRVIDQAKAESLGMGGLLAVGAGGSSPPRIVELTWAPDAAGRDTTLLVGKTITFDTGGYSLKTGGSMKGMKYDKCGGCATIGAMEAVARLKLPRRVVGLIACAENMIDREAYRVDDILTMHNGVTVEVTNTDAEGRLVLADALSWGVKEHDPAAVFDLATLTGGVITALGHDVCGAWCPDEPLWGQVAAAAEATGERVWRLPVDETYREMMKAKHADLHNSAPVRAAHPIQGAAFLSHFVGAGAATAMPTVPWCHLDIAGVATTDKDTAMHDTGPTGWGVRLLTAYLSS